jgi:hypothetical protein
MLTTYKKYIKYKQKYIQAKKKLQFGGGVTVGDRQLYQLFKYDVSYREFSTSHGIYNSQNDQLYHDNMLVLKNLPRLPIMMSFNINLFTQPNKLFCNAQLNSHSEIDLIQFMLSNLVIFSSNGYAHLKCVTNITDNEYDQLHVHILENHSMSLCGDICRLNAVRVPNAKRTCVLNCTSPTQHQMFDVKGVGMPHSVDVWNDTYQHVLKINPCPQIKSHETGTLPIGESIYEYIMTYLIYKIVTVCPFLHNFYNVDVVLLYCVIQLPFIDKYSGDNMSLSFREAFQRCLHIKDVSRLSELQSFIFDTVFKLFGINTGYGFYYNFNVQASNYGNLPTNMGQLKNDIHMHFSQNGSKPRSGGCCENTDNPFNYVVQIHDVAHFSLFTTTARDKYEEHRYPDDIPPEQYLDFDENIKSDRSVSVGLTAKFNELYDQLFAKYMIMPLQKYYVNESDITDVLIEKRYMYWGMTKVTIAKLMDDVHSSDNPIEFVNNLINESFAWIDSRREEINIDIRNLFMTLLA